MPLRTSGKTHSPARFINEPLAGIAHSTVPRYLELIHPHGGVGNLRLCHRIAREIRRIDSERFNLCAPNRVTLNLRRADSVGSNFGLRDSVVHDLRRLKPNCSQAD